MFDPEHLTSKEEEAIDGFCRASGKSRETTVNMLASVAGVIGEGRRAGAGLAKEVEAARKRVDKWSKAARKAMKVHGQGKRKRGKRNPYSRRQYQ